MNVLDKDVDFDSNEAIGFLDARSFSYNKIDHKALQQKS